MRRPSGRRVFASNSSSSKSPLIDSDGWLQGPQDKKKAGLGTVYLMHSLETFFISGLHCGETAIEPFLQALAFHNLAVADRGVRGYARTQLESRFPQPFPLVYGLGEIYR
jgi:hypothetical protein